jgi:hypothetical protein
MCGSQYFSCIKHFMHVTLRKCTHPVANLYQSSVTNNSNTSLGKIPTVMCKVYEFTYYVESAHLRHFSLTCNMLMLIENAENSTIIDSTYTCRVDKLLLVSLYPQVINTPAM